MQYDTDRGAAKISALSSGEIDKYEYLTGEVIIPPYQIRVMGQVKFTYFPLRKAFEKQKKKTIEDQGEKHKNVLEQHGNQLIKCNNEKKEYSEHSKQKEIFEELATKRME